MSLEINKRVNEERKKQGYTQEFMASALYMKKTTYSQMERSGKISAEVLIKIATILNVDIRYFLFGDENYKIEQSVEKYDFSTQEESIIKILRNLKAKDRNDAIDYIESKYKAKKY